MIEEQAVVISCEGEFAWVETQRQTACGQCAVNKGCGTSVLAQVLGNRRTRVRAINPKGARAGDTVVIGLEEGAFLRGSMAVYLLPLLTLFLGGLFGEMIAGRMVPGQEWPVLLGALAGGLLGMWWLRRFSQRIMQDRRYQPVILSRVPPAPVAIVQPPRPSRSV